MPNARGIQILKILETVKKYKSISLEEIILELSINEPYIKKTTALKLIDDLIKSKNSIIKMNDEGLLCIVKR